MLDIKFIRENPQKVKDACIKKNLNGEVVEEILELDIKRRNLLTSLENLRAKQNRFTEQEIEKAKENKAEIKKLEPEVKEAEEKLQKLVFDLPNVPLEGVPVGKDESENVVLRKVGVLPKFTFQPKDHLELGEMLDIIDTKTASVVSGARFAYLKNEAAMIQFALVQLALSVLTSPAQMKKIADSVGVNRKVFSPVVPPVMIKPDVYTRMARLSEQDKTEKYYIQSDDVYLIGSAEHTLGPLHIDEVVAENRLPLRYVGYSTSFRREAGSYGKDTKGILRMHQFDKVEMESFTKPEDSAKEQDFFVAIQEYLLKLLGIPYQVMIVCTGDMGKPDARQIDIECWVPSQNRYRETHSADLMTDFQARRLNIRYRDKAGKVNFVHTLNGTAFAIGRILIMIMENYQQKNGSIKVPKALRKYCGFKIIK